MNLLFILSLVSLTTAQLFPNTTNPCSPSTPPTSPAPNFSSSPPPYTLQPYIILSYSEYTPSGNRRNEDPTATIKFQFADPNTRFGYVDCLYRWDVRGNGTRPDEGFWPCVEGGNRTMGDSEEGVWFRKTGWGGGEKFGRLVARRRVVSPETGATYRLVGDGTLYSRGTCSGSGHCYWSWVGIPSLLKVVEEKDWKGVSLGVFVGRKGL